METVNRAAGLTRRMRRLIDLDRALRHIGLPGLLERQDDEVAQLEMNVTSAQRRRACQPSRNRRSAGPPRLRLLRGGLSDEPPYTPLRNSPEGV